MQIKLKYQLGFSSFLLLIFTFFYSHGREDEETGGREHVKKGVDLSKTKLWIKTNHNEIHKKREFTREFVEYISDEVLLGNIKEAYTQLFKEKRNCDVLASEQGPSCMRLDQSIKATVDHGLCHFRWKKQKVLETKQLRKNLLFPKVYLLLIWWNWENLSKTRKQVL